MRPPTADDPAAMQLRFTAEQVTVRVPSLVVWGEADTALPPSLVDGLEAFVPKLELVRVPGASHWIVHEQPGLVTRVLREFLAR